ncbi:hypothetical protein [Dyella thiooxydans]|nr:hypothetical protein [Dyella thiooxydans]
MACLMVGVALSGPIRAEAAQDRSTMAWAVILDPHQPLDLRRQTLAGLEEHAPDDDQHDLYLLGSLYQMGPKASGAPVPQDLTKATLYLGNAALRGSLLAMAKMAEIKLAEHKDREAMIWAQVFAHYVTQVPGDERPPEGYIAELVQRILDRLGQAGMPQVMSDVAGFVAQHDAAILAGLRAQSRAKTPRPQSGEHFVTMPPGRFAPQSGIADYLVAFRPDGSVEHAWLLDAVPNPSLGGALHHYVHGMTLPARSGEDGRLRYEWVPAMYDDHRYRAKSGA